MNLKIDEALRQDEDFQNGLEEYKSLEQKANSVAEEISSTLVDSIVKEQGKFNITTAILAVAKSLSHLTSYLYDTEEDFLIDVKKARTSVVSDVIPALLDPQPCGNCESCKNGSPMECINPEVRGDHTTSRFLPILCNMLIEYDLFNKVMYMHSAGKEDNEPTLDEASIPETKKNEEE
jgi:hypothetical protein